MKNLTPEFNAERRSSATSHCYAIDVGGFRVTNWDEDLTIDGELYEGGYPIEALKLKAGTGGLIKIGTVDGAFISLLINHQLNGKDCAAMEVLLQEDFTVAGFENLFYGAIDGPYLNLGWVHLPVGKKRIEAEAPVPRRRLVAACGFGFKYPSCGYVGTDAHCMKTRETCRNLSRFGGFRFIPPPGKKFVWGGTVYKVEG